MIDTFLIVGKPFTRLCDYLTKHNYKFVVLLDQRIKDSFDFPTVLCDFSEKSQIIRAVESIAKQYHIIGVTAIYENYILPVAWIAEHLNLPGMPIEAAMVCTDKYLMRQKFAEAKEKISPDFSLVKSVDDLKVFAKNHSYPMILKPTNLAKSLLVTKANNEKELLDQYQHSLAIIGELYSKYSPHRPPRMIVEEYLDGTIHSVDAFTNNEGNSLVLNEVVDYQTGHDIGYNDNFHYSRLLPSKLKAEYIDAIRRVAEVGCKAIGMKNSPAHIEVILTKDGPKIVEIGARNGGYRERMHMLANGIDISACLLSTITGKEPNIKAEKNEPCAVLELFPKNPGIFDGINEEEQLKLLESLAYYRVVAKVGKFVGKSSDGYKACAIIMLHNHNATQFNKDLEFVNSKVYVKTKKN